DTYMAAPGTYGMEPVARSEARLVRRPSPTSAGTKGRLSRRTRTDCSSNWERPRCGSPSAPPDVRRRARRRRGRGRDRGASRPAQSLPRPEQGLLARVVSVMNRAEHPVAVRVQLAAVQLDQALEGLLVMHPYRPLIVCRLADRAPAAGCRLATNGQRVRRKRSARGHRDRPPPQRAHAEAVPVVFWLLDDAEAHAAGFAGTAVGGRGGDEPVAAGRQQVTGHSAGEREAVGARWSGAGEAA
ncbi:MAG: hypothetical protein QOI42_1478, partial [Frankiaceae bacterium]|nr:hypothetical protein [Frankiaceae bacterium]